MKRIFLSVTMDSITLSSYLNPNISDKPDSTENAKFKLSNFTRRKGRGLASHISCRRRQHNFTRLERDRASIPCREEPCNGPVKKMHGLNFGYVFRSGTNHPKFGLYIE